MITAASRPASPSPVGHRQLGSRIGVLLGVIALLLGVFSPPAMAAEDPTPVNVARTAAPDASYTAPWNSLLQRTYKRSVLVTHNFQYQSQPPLLNLYARGFL